MIICNRCGKQVPAGLARCQNCGMPLAGAANNTMNAQEQGELPAWLESLRANERPGIPAGGQPNFSTADLIDDDLPGWMRAEQGRDGGENDSSKHPAIRPASMPAPNTDAGMMRAESFSARDLIDPVSLPSWMNPGQQPANPATPTISKGANELQGYPQGVPPQQTSPAPLFSANDFVDRQSMPTWMSSGQPPVQPLNQATWQGNLPPVTPAPTPVPPATRQGNPAPAAPATFGDSGPESGLPASSLLDFNSLPPWLREGQQAQGQLGSNNNMSAGSLIDMNALPSWLRAVDGQPQGSQAERNAPPPLSGTSPRIENVRVPSRPRAEMMPPEQSAAAANVFSSMLGVASNTPYPPAPNAGGQQNFSSTPPQPSGSLYTAQPASPMAMPPGAVPQAPQQGTMPGSHADNYTNAYQNNYPNTQNPYAANQAQSMQPPAAAMQPGAFNAGQGNPMNSTSANVKPGKRSFLDTIREWFHLN